MPEREYDPTLQSPSERRSLLKQGVLRLRRLFLPSLQGLGIGDNFLTAKDDGSGNQDPFWQRADGTEVNLTDLLAGGGGSGTMTTVKEDGSQVGGADIEILDFLGADFDITESPDKEINIVIAAAIARVAALHAEYLDSDAILAVEGEATLDLAGLIKLLLNNTTVQTDAEYIRGEATAGIIAIDLRNELIINLDTNDNGIEAAVKIRHNGSVTDMIILREDGSVLLLEKAAAGTDIAGYGQLWVKTATPNELWFTRDDGTEIQLDLAGAASYASIAETNTGTETAKSVTPDGLAGSNYGERTIGYLVSDPGGDAITVGDGKVYARIPSTMNGWNLVEVAASLSTVSSSGAVTVMVRRSRRSTATTRANADMLSTALTIDASEFDSEDAATAAVINGSNDDVNEGDHIYIDIDVAGTGAKGLFVLTTWRLP